MARSLAANYFICKAISALLVGDGDNPPLWGLLMAPAQHHLLQQFKSAKAQLDGAVTVWRAPEPKQRGFAVNIAVPR